MPAWGAAFAMVVTTIALALWSPRALGEPIPSAATPAEEDSARYLIFAHGETHAALFSRALAPGNGALVSNATVAPLRQYVLVRARELDTNPHHGKIDFELAAWSSATLGDARPEQPLDGDVQTANVGYRRDALALRLGRQQVTGGAARFARFDGLEVAVDLGAGLNAEGYGGFTVLPRWDARPGYHYLGAAVDSELRHPEAIPSPDRGRSWLVGGSLGWSAPRVTTGLSFHEQRGELGLVRRNLGADARASILDTASLGASGLVALDSARLADARVYGDWVPLRELSLSLEYLHTEPALFLSRESVLSVFSTTGFNETGAIANARLTRALAVEGRGFAQFYVDGRPGARAELAGRVSLGQGGAAFARLAYARVVAPSNGYHALRASLARRLVQSIFGTLEAYGYFYDKAIRGRLVSSVYAGTLSYRPTGSLSALLGASLAQSPYARFDAQTQVALAYNFDYLGAKEGR